MLDLSSNPLATRDDFITCCKALIEPTLPYVDSSNASAHIGNTTTHYGMKIADMESFSRFLWGVFPLLCDDSTNAQYDAFWRGIAHGTDPEHQAYWGEVGQYDQRVVEMAVYGFGMVLMGESFWHHFTDQEQHNICQWLNQSATAVVPDNNWHFFPVLVQLGFKLSGKPYHHWVFEQRLNEIENYYLGDGWYADGIGRPRDYYISMGFHFYSLIYAKHMLNDDSKRSQRYIRRAKQFSQDFLWMFSQQGDAIAFGRSLTYRFAQGAFWSAVAYADQDIVDLGVVKGLLLRHLRFWFQHPIFDNSGLLSIGYHYPNLIMAEDYNSPGSSYWAAKIFVAAALPMNHPFWQVDEQPFPTLNGSKCLPHAGQVITHSEQSHHAWLLTAGQLELNNYVNTDAKYTKFAYSNRYGFTLERGRYGLAHAGGDSMLLFGEGDGYFRGRRDCELLSISNQSIVCQWNPWNNVEVTTWLIPMGDWHVRVHLIDSERELIAVEGGFTLPQHDNTMKSTSSTTAQVCNDVECSRVSILSKQSTQAKVIALAPNSNILYPQRPLLPISQFSVAIGSTLVCHAFYAGNNDNQGDSPLFTSHDDHFELNAHGNCLRFSLIDILP